MRAAGSNGSDTLATGEVEVLYTHVDGRSLCGPNDLVFDRDGGFWFTDHGKLRERDQDRTGVFYAKADGSQIRGMIFPMAGPNGIGLSPAEDEVYIAETPTGQVWAYELSGPGELLGERRAANPTVVACLRDARGTSCSTHSRSTPMATSVWRRSSMVASRCCRRRAPRHDSCRCPIASPRTSASVAMTCEPPTSHFRRPAGSSRPHGTPRGCASTTAAEARPPGAAPCRACTCSARCLLPCYP